MRKFGLFLLALNAAGFLLVRRTDRQRDSVSLHYAEGSMVSLEQGSPAFDRLVGLARQAL